MIGIESIKYSLRNLWKRKTRSFLTILSIFIGIATIFLFISFGLGLYAYVEEFTTGSSVDKVIVQARGGGAPGLDSSFILDESDLRVVQRSAGVMDATGSSFKVAEVKQGTAIKYTFLMSYDPKKPLIWDISNVDLYSGKELTGGDTKKVVLGYNYLVEDRIFPKAYKVNDKINVQGEDLRIMGFLEPIGNPQDDSQIYITNDYMKDLYSNTTFSYGWIVARVDPDKIEWTIEHIERDLRQKRGLDKGKEDFFVQSFTDMIESYSIVLDIIIGFIVLIALISVVVSAVNTANTMVTSVLERYKEIGVIKAIGARNREVFGIFLFESSFLGLLAGLIGVGLGYLLASFGGYVLNSLGWGFLSPAFPPSLFIGCIIFATVTGGISGVVPAIRASKINVVRALRYE